MKDLSEQELDNFFQKSLGKRQIPFNPKAWEKMEAKLEEEKKKRLLYKRLLLGLSLLLITFGSAYFFGQGKKEQQISINTQLLTNNKQEEIKETNNGVAETTISNDSRKIINQLSLNQRVENKSNKPSDPSNQAKSDGRFDLPKEQKITKKTDAQKEEIGNQQKLLLALDSIEITEKHLLVSKLDSFKKIETTYVIPETTKSVIPKTALPFGRLNIGLALSPDWSSVRFQNINQTGYKLGLDIEYQFVKKVSISTGVIFSRLFYNTNNSEYTVPKGFWTNQIKPEKVWGTCDALEVPINLRYALFTSNRQRIFISAGISSYWMLNENYSFEYAANMPSNLVAGWSGSNKSKHYLSIANFSLGYSGMLSSRSFWQIEPFVKLPLNSVGWGKVDLSSMGIFFSWKYILVK